MEGETLTVRRINIFSTVIGILSLVFFIIVLTGITGTVTRHSWISFTVLLSIGGIGCVVSPFYPSFTMIFLTHFPHTILSLHP